MKILWVNEEASNFGGCETYIRNTVQALKVRGHRSYLFYKFDCLAEQEFTGLFEEAYPLVELQRQLRSIEPDIVFIHRWQGVELHEGIPAMGYPTVRMFHDHRPFCLRDHGISPITGQSCQHSLGVNCYLDLGFIVRSSGMLPIKIASLSDKKRHLHAIKKSSAYMVASSFMVDKLERHQFNKSKINLIPLYVDSPLADVEEQVVKDNKLVFYAGQLIKGKGVDLLIKALANVEEDFTLAIAGKGNDEEKLKALAKELHIAEKTEFLGHLSKAELAHYYQKALMLVVPSRVAETFGLVGPEAMSYGTAVIASNQGGNKEWLVHEKTGLLVPPNEITGLTHAIRTLLQFPELAQKYGKEGKRRYEEHYTSESHISKLLSLFSCEMKKSKRVAA